jgi:putative transposase
MATGSWELEVVKRAPLVRGWDKQPKRWIVERTFAWLLRNRRLVVDYERKVQTSETLIELAFIRFLVRRATTCTPDKMTGIRTVGR